MQIPLQGGIGQGGKHPGAKSWQQDKRSQSALAGGHLRHLVILSLDILLKEHFPVHLPFQEEEQEIEEVDKFMNFDRSEETLQYFQVWRVKAAIASFQPLKAAGPYDLKPVVLQHIGDKGLATITNLFKRWMMSSFIPKRWRQMKSSLHPKVGKG